MADSRRSTGSEQHRGTGADSHDRVEVFDVATGGIREQDTTTGSNQHTDNGMSPYGDTGLGNVDLRDARVVTSDAEPTNFRTTDLRDSELNTTATGNRTDIGAAGQGTNWGTILMVIAIILVIILLGSWLF